MKKYLLFTALLLVINQVATYGATPKKVACIGASITYGALIANREQNSYPAQLQRMLGKNYVVTNYGVSGTTLLQQGDQPYRSTFAYREALSSQPDVVIIDLGGNDAKQINRAHLVDFEHDYKDLIHSFKELPSHPRIVLLTAMASFVADSAGIFDPILTKRINPQIQKVAYDEQVEVIDMHSPFVNKPELFADHLHPDAQGAGIMARNVYQVIGRARDAGFNIFDKLSIPFKQSNYYGYDCAEFTFQGRQCKVVKPRVSAAGHPWIWRARFWGHEPQTEIALLQQGFYVVYCDVAELLGNKQSIRLWNGFYQLLHQSGLAKKAVMEGMSRGGVYVFNWAAENRDKVAAVYVDNPLLNMPSWASQFLHQADVKDDMFKAFKKDFNLETDADVTNFKQSPVDKVKQIVAGKYPILILCADEDETVIPQENTILFEQKIKALGGAITVMHKPGFKHHPHSFPNPQPIVDFILNATRYTLPDNQ